MVVGRQHAGARGFLPHDQGVNRLQIQVQRWRGSRVDDLHHGACTQVVEQQEALGLMPVQHLGGADASVVQQLRDLHKGRAVFLVRWRVHDDQAVAVRAACGVNAQIAAKAGVGRGQTQALRPQCKARLHAGQPGLKLGLALGVGPQHRLGCGLGAGGSGGRGNGAHG